MFETEQTRLNNIASCIERNLPELEPYPAHAGKWSICAGGPSLRKEYKKAKGVIVSVNGTHDYLLSKKVKPHVFVMVDPREENEKFLRKPQHGITYYIAAHCHPKVFDRLEGYNCQVWYPLEYNLPTFSIGGGSTVGLRSINIGYVLGFRNIHLYGFDGCVKHTGHAYPQDDQEATETVYDGKKYLMTEWMRIQADNFAEMVANLDFKLTVHTSGIIKHIGDNNASK